MFTHPLRPLALTMFLMNINKNISEKPRDMVDIN